MDQRAIEGRRDRFPIGRKVDLCRDYWSIDPCIEAACPSAELARQHRVDRARDVGAEGASSRLLIERPSYGNEMRDVGDMHEEPKPAVTSLHDNRVVMVLRAVRINRHHGLLT